MATFGLLHGAWHGSSCWKPLEESLGAMGHAAVAPELPLHDPEAGYLERAGPVIDALEGRDGEIVVVAHSQSSALGPLVVAHRPVSLLVYLCPRMGGIDLPDGAPAAFREGFPFPPALPNGATAWDPEVAKDVMYPRLSPDVAEALTRHLQPMAMPPDEYPLEQHPNVPSALIYAADDEFFEPAFERFVARELLGVDPIEVSGGHFQMVEDPDRLARLLVRLARTGPAPPG
jgi:pimeloyl-ACP methyl ester carboxylesterase